MTSVKAGLENEKQLRLTEEAEMRKARERGRHKSLGRGKGVRTRLGGITNLVQDQHEESEIKKASMEERERKDMRMQDVYGMGGVTKASPVSFPPRMSK